MVDAFLIFGYVIIAFSFIYDLNDWSFYMALTGTLFVGGFVAIGENVNLGKKP